MRKFLMLLALVATQAFAEASFDQIESLIQQKNYAAAEQGLEVIVKNHPQSAKAFYAMAQAQAGLGNLEKAQKALNIATGLNPTLDFAPEGSVQKLKQAITPQTAKIEAVEESHFWPVLLFVVGLGGVGVLIYFAWGYKKDRDAEELAKSDAKFLREEQARQAEEARNAKLSDIMSQPISKPKATTSQPTASIATSGPAVQQPLYTPQPAPQPTHTTIVNNNSSNDGLLTGILIGDMMNHHHDTTRVVEREVIREVPAPSRDTSWDDTPSRSSSRSSSWDDDSSSSSSSSSRSSSWDDSSSSSSSSSWSSSSSDSSSSWSDSSSSSSSSDW